jgi:hypothetical protein
VRPFSGGSRNQDQEADMNHNRRTCLAMAGLLVLSLPQAARARQAPSFDTLARALKPGDIVSVTRWSGYEHKGALADLTACSIVLVAGAERVRVDAPEVRVVRRLGGPKPAAAEDRIADAGKRCESAGCMAMSLALSGGTMIRRVGRIFSRPETVYRAPDRRAVPEICRTEARSASMHLR